MLTARPAFYEGAALPELILWAVLATILTLTSGLSVDGRIGEEGAAGAPHRLLVKGAIQGRRKAFRRVLVTNQQSYSVDIKRSKKFQTAFSGKVDTENDLGRIPW